MDNLLGQLPQIEEGEIVNLTVAATSAEACLRGRYRKTGKLVAVKLLRNPSTSQRGDWPKREPSQPCQAYSERLLVPLGVYRTRFLSGVVWEWLNAGSLHSLLHETKLYPDVPVCLRLRILSDVAEGLVFLHSALQPHLSLRATHVLLDQDYRAKLSDWGLSDVHHPERPKPCSRHVPYLSPEALQGRGLSPKTDLYSFGVLLWETLNRQRASEDFIQLQTMMGGAEQRLEQSNLLPSETANLQALTKLALSCWNSDPLSRPSAEDCITVLGEALKTFDPEAPVKAALHLKELKERALLDCKDSTAWEIPIELDNLENSADFKHMRSKTLPLDIPRAHVPTPLSAGGRSPQLPSPHRPGPHGTCCLGGVKQTLPCSQSPSSPCVLANSRVQLTARALAASSPPLPSSSPLKTPSPPLMTSSPPLKTPSPPLKTPSPLLTTPSPSCAPALPAPPQSRCRNPGQPVCCPLQRVSCQGLLQQRRELIVRSMTEGRLNHLLDVLRSRRVLSCEAYEIITAAVTLAARTRSLLDTCCCLGESVAALVAITLGLVSVTSSSSATRTSQLAH